MNPRKPSCVALLAFGLTASLGALAPLSAQAAPDRDSSSDKARSVSVTLARPAVQNRRSAGSKYVRVTGTVQVIAGEHGQADATYILRGDGTSIPITSRKDLEPGARIRATLAVPGTGGLLRGTSDRSALRSATRAGSPLQVRTAYVSSGLPAPAAGHLSYVVKLANLGPFVKQPTDAALLAVVNAAQNYWISQAGGAITSWQVAGFTAINTTTTSLAAGCGTDTTDFRQVVAEAGQAAYPGVDFSGRTPNHLVVLVPDACATVWAGRANRNISFANGGNSVSSGGDGLMGTVTHELGHNLGFEHANNQAAEYGDVYEVMGSGPEPYAVPALGSVYRWENGVQAPGEIADGSAGGTWNLVGRSATTGLRGVTVIDPDTGRRMFIDNRDGAGIDAGTFYKLKPTSVIPSYGQAYAPGIVVERDDRKAGAYVMPAAGNNGSLQAGEQWSNSSGSLIIKANSATQVQVSRVPRPVTVAAGSVGIAGTPRALETLTAAPTGFSPAGAMRYQWYRNGVAIQGAEDNTYDPPLDSIGSAITVQAVGYYLGYNPSAAVMSAPVTVQPAKWYALSKVLPTIVGTPRVGQVLTATAGMPWVASDGYRPVGFGVAWTWLRNGKPIPGATGPTYTLQGLDLLQTITVRETPTAPGFGTDSWATSAGTPPIGKGSLVKTARPKIKGRPRVGKTLKAKTPGWDAGVRFKYQWFANGKKIKKATKKKLVVSRSLRRKKIVVRVIGRKQGYVSVAKKSKKVRIR